MSPALVMLCALAVEAVCSWPDWLYRRIRHPVVWIGSLIDWLDARLNKARFSQPLRYGLGMVTTVVVVGVCVGAAVLVVRLLPDSAVWTAVEVMLAASLLASRSLYDHVARVAKPLLTGDSVKAREAVAQIVGRDPEHLDDTGVARAALESLAENASDGVVAPLFWGALLGLPGIAAYKAINTLDSMIGHRTERHEAFGGFAARLDDVMNFVPARLTGALIAVVSLRKAAWRVMMRDAGNHRSPNAGWPESAMAGALGIRLSGPRVYSDRTSPEPWLNDGARDPSAVDLQSGLTIYVLAICAAGVLLFVSGLVQWTLM